METGPVHGSISEHVYCVLCIHRN